MPWSAAKMMIRPRSSRGSRVPRRTARSMAVDSKRPREPGGLTLLSIACCALSLRSSVMDRPSDPQIIPRGAAGEDRQHHGDAIAGVLDHLHLDTEGVAEEGRREYFLARALGEDPACAEQHGTVGEERGQVQVVQAEHDGGSAVSAEAP